MIIKFENLSDEINVTIDELNQFLHQNGEYITVNEKRYVLQSHYIWNKIYRVSLKPVLWRGGKWPK